MSYVGEVVDLFCGIGGISHGFKQAGFNIRAGYDVDPSCKYGFESNNESRFVESNIETLNSEMISDQFSGLLATVLVGCAPCQPFSSYRKGKIDSRWSLLASFAKLATKVKTDFVTMENVPGLVKYQDGSVFQNFLRILSSEYPYISHQVVDCSKFGVPQKRHRLVVIASKSAKIQLTNDFQSPVKVADAIANLPSIPAGGADPTDSMHRASSLNEINIQRIKSSKPGGSWHDWPEDLVAHCHQDKKGAGYTSVYGRMKWDCPAPTITTQCFGYGNGRFGHPEQDRAITLREAALLQSFPLNYSFFPDDEFPGFKTVGRWIGNAVPVALAKNIAKCISKEIYKHV